MKKLKLVALLAIFALVVATFVTMLAIPTSAAVTDSNADAATYTGFANDSAALTAGCIGRFGDATGTTVKYVKSMAAVKTYLGDSTEYAKFNLLVDLNTSVRLQFYNETNAVEATDIVGQTEQVCKNLCAVLEAAGTSIDKAVKTTCFLADMGDFAAFNEVYGKYFTSKPARSCVAVKTLPKNVLCEVEVIAEAGSTR